MAVLPRLASLPPFPQLQGFQKKSAGWRQSAFSGPAAPPTPRDARDNVKEPCLVVAAMRDTSGSSRQRRPQRFVIVAICSGWERSLVATVRGLSSPMAGVSQKKEPPCPRKPQNTIKRHRSTAAKPPSI